MAFHFRRRVTWLWKFALVEAENPGWDGLWEQWFAPDTAQK
ncbi:hypothetical protein FHS52_001016 [Erythromicrobium ramosum]|uniref:Uncharacterized protein n=1 Tax=Erythrobacter ramosus TaxID=35811 RepID=A0ABR6HWR5_9SPHN|nr:hypothetical protein [Erythrobacter ramosus]MBB3775073.1 hypothetical protein [Erythrobacter ramosus]